MWFVTGAEVSPLLRCTRRSFGFLLLNAMTREVVFEKKKTNVVVFFGDMIWTLNIFVLDVAHKRQKAPKLFNAS
jgi:hypothetical protein